ncbi:hypothetical protein X798_02494 [Onchocerca flexuosa]|uniref:ILCR1 Ig-like domain-containing protein n=1 Tax=Onchocerca flexuosa TaxID=387005 RepID=A0A238BYX4_9BILA|nr:hypothetical protein X798_02494 [Onchocerca flexuosa]
MAYCINVVRFTIIIIIIVAVVVTSMNINFDPLFHHNCADYNHKDFVCTVRSVQCDDESITVNENSNNISKMTDTTIRYAHDIRVESFARVVTRYAKQTYQLSVDISWQLPPNNSTSLLLGFILEIEDSMYNRSCFYFDISNFHWNSNLIAAVPRFHFASESLFEFDEAYDIKLISLSKRKNDTMILRKHIQMPHHPDYYNDTTTEHDCKRTSNLQASRWTGGFRRILVHPIARTIQVEFVGAPPHYCFEGYEVRLKDESGLELLHSAVVPVELMYVEYIGNQTILFGEYNFTNLEVDQYFMPSVIPIERSRDGRCLCPVLSTSPYDNRMVCSCIAADWHKVRIQRIEKPLTIAPELEENNTLILHAEHNSSEYIWQLDVWDITQIERNLLDYISISILNADKVVIINSEGAYYHYRCKIQQEYYIERKEPEPLDGLFDKQIDQVLMHSSVISVRFKYTIPLFILPPLSYSLQYMVPDNIAALISNLTDSNIKNDSRILSYSSAFAKLVTAVTETSEILENDPNWFINTHWRVSRPIIIDKKNQVPIRHIMGKNIEESENIDIRKAQISIKPKILSELPDELIDGSRSAAVVSSEIILESENLTDAAEIQIVTTTDTFINDEHNVANQLDQLNKFPVIDGSKSPEKRPSSDGYTLQDSGFISGKDITN